jgi:hypothetical protein
MSPPAVTARLRRASELSDLHPDRRLDGKLDMTPAAVTTRLKEVAALLRLTLKLGEAGRAPRR